MPFLPRHLRTLEFDKVLEMLAQHSTFSVGTALVESLTPSTDDGEVLHAQDVTEEARRVLEARPNSGVRGARDVRPHVARAAVGAPLQPFELLEVAATISSGRAIRNLLTRQELRTPTLARLARSIADLDELEHTIRRAVDDEGRVLDTASDQLRAIRQELRASFERLMRRLNEMITSPSLRDALQDPIITQRSGRYVVPVKAEMRGRVRGIVHDQSASGATLFVEPLPIVELTNKWKQHQIEEEREIERILLELSGQVANARYGLLETVDVLAQLDLAFAKGKLAVQMEATRPALVSFNRMPAGSPAVKLLFARHPLLRGDVVPMSVELGREYDILLITGPNTGGKTVALKTVGLLILMAQAGLQIPADEGSVLAMFSGVFADIGDEQSIEQSLSTFSSHVSRIIEVLKLADRHSLVLLDEVGAGTDPQEGSALSRAILEHLAASRIYTIATTHSSELKTFAYTTPRVENASVEFDTNTLRPTYHLTVGLPGRSNALAIAQRLGMPKSIVDSARNMLSPTQVQADELLAEIHEQLTQARDERSAAARIRSEADRSLHQLRSRQAALEREKAEILSRAEQEGAELARDLRREAEALRRELRGMRAERTRLTEIEDRISQLRRPAASGQVTTDGEEPRPLVSVGQHVRVESLGVVGVVRSLAGNGETAEVEIDGKRFKLSAADLRPTEAAATASPRTAAVNAGYLAKLETTRQVGSEGWSPIQSQLDLRGLTTEEARYRLDQFLNDAYMEGLQNVRIVHGKGTGAVRQAVRDILVDHPLVRSHATAALREGGEGATEVRLTT